MNALKHIEDLGTLAEEVGNLAAALTLPMPDAIHVKALKERLPGLRDRLRAVYVGLSGENPWEGYQS